jgi:hypothetical protein
MIFQVKGQIVSIIEKYKEFPEYQALVNKLIKKDAQLKMALEYLHFVYSRKSSYFRIVLLTRKKEVCRDRFQNADLWEKIENATEVMALARKMDLLQFTEKEAMLEGVKRKISEYIHFYNTTPITNDNREDLKEMLAGSKNLVAVLKELQKEVNEEQQENGTVDDDDSELFEVPDRY